MKNGSCREDDVAHLELSLAERGALALADAATELDKADDTAKFVLAMERNRRVWQTLREVAVRHHWQVPNRRQADYALATTRTMGHGITDHHVHALIDMNRRISAQLAGDRDIDHIRRRAYFIWEESGRPHGQDLSHWLLAELEVGGRQN